MSQSFNIIIIVENIEGVKFGEFGERTIVRQILECQLCNNVGHKCWNAKIIITKQNFCSFAKFLSLQFYPLYGITCMCMSMLRYTVVCIIFDRLNAWAFIQKEKSELELSTHRLTTWQATP